MTATLTTRTTTTKEKKMTTTLTRQPAALAVLDIEVDGPAPSYATTTGIHVPDIPDDDGFRYWIGPDATVGVSVDADLTETIAVLERAGWMARTGQAPSMSGILVWPHSGHVERGPLQKNGHLFTLWHMARRTLLTDQEDC